LEELAEDSLPVFFHPFAFLFTLHHVLQSHITTTISLPSFMTPCLYFLRHLACVSHPLFCLFSPHCLSFYGSLPAIPFLSFTPRCLSLLPSFCLPSSTLACLFTSPCLSFFITPSVLLGPICLSLFACTHPCLF
jgi:hypothetical protein